MFYSSTWFLVSFLQLTIILFNQWLFFYRIFSIQLSAIYFINTIKSVIHFIFTLVSTPFNEHLIGIEDYNYSFVKSRSNGTRGGHVALMIHKSLKATRLHLALTLVYLFLAVNVQIPNTHIQDIIILVVYRPPGQDINNFVDNITPILKTLRNTKKTCFICGNFNIHLLNYNNRIATQSFLDSLMSFSFRPLINMPTRITELTSTLIDNVFTNNHCDAHISGIFLHRHQ